MSANGFFITVITFSYVPIQVCSHHNSFILWYLFHCLILVQPECFLFFMYAPHLQRICTDNIQITPSSSIFKHIILSVTLHISTTLSTCSFFNRFPHHSFCFLFHSTTFYILHLAFFSFQGVSCVHSMSIPLCSIRSATSLPLPVTVLTFNIATLSLIFLVFFLSSFFSFFLLHCFPPLFCIQAACPPVALGAQLLVTVVIIPGLDRSGIKSDTTRIENIWLGFTPDALPVATLSIYPGLEPAPKLL